MRNKLLALAFGLLFLCVVPSVEATSAVSTNLKDTYRITDSTTVHVERELTFTNRIPDLYVSQYTFSYYNTQQTRFFTVSEDGEPAQFTTQRKGTALEVVVTLKHPAVGIGKTKKITVGYDLADYLQDGGLYKELIISPTRVSTDEDIRSYVIEVQSPEYYQPVSIAKPLGNRVRDHDYYWENVQNLNNENLYLSYGNEALYELELQYALQNKYPYSRSYAIPFPPDGAWQQVIVDHITPAPKETYVDEDGNFMGVYTVSGNSTLNITFKGVVRLTTEPREEVHRYMRAHYAPALLQSRYLAPQQYWTLSSAPSALFNTPKDMYTFVTDTLSYNDARINANLKRMGASWALSNPQQAICMEYADLFIALARENNLPAREVVGYGVTQDDKLLPLSFYGDILHAWPEYYDRARELWHPIDPTWGDTAQLDYFSSFDLSHIAFVYHGTSDEYPYPPGVYKGSQQKTKDVYVKLTTTSPTIRTSLAVSGAPEYRFFGAKQQSITLTVTSESNVFQYNVMLSIRDDKGHEVGSDAIEVLAPLQSIRRSIAITPPTTALRSSGKLNFFLNNTLITTRPYESYSSLVAALRVHWQYVVFIGFCIGLAVVIMIQFRR